MEYRVQHVIFRKQAGDGDDIVHHARIITYVDIRKGKARLVSMLTNDMDMEWRTSWRFITRDGRLSCSSSS